MATKKTKENKTTKSKKTKTNKASTENTEVVVAKVEPKVESLTVEVTLQEDGEVTGGTVSKEQIEDLVDSGVCVDMSSNDELVNEMTEEVKEAVIESFENKVDANFNEETKEIDFTINEDENNEVTVGVGIGTIVEEKEENGADFDYIVKCDDNGTQSVSCSENTATTITEQKEEPVKPEKPVKKKKRGVLGSVYKWFGAQIDL